VKQNKKKIFSGHNNAGYACQLGFSPDSKYLFSGDAMGKLYFWDWQSSRVLKNFKVHDDGPCMGTLFHPLRPSMMATCGWDGLIKLWE
jgi:pre-mRNA-processing factor 17